jgi:acyl-CoA synthetase (AMP-forming)/AMP-acid ligase II
VTAGVENNVVKFLQEAARRVPDRPALIFGEGERASFAALWERADRISAGLGGAGLSPGDRVIVMIPMSLELYAVLLGLLKLGVVAVFVDPWIGRKQIAAFAAFADPRGFAGIGKSHLLRLLDGRLRRIPVTLTTGGKLFRWPARLSLGDLESKAGDGRVHPVTGDDPALITFTSGSSGLPKGTNRTHRFLTAQHGALKHEFPADDRDVDMPMFPVFALNNLALGISSVVPRMDFGRVAEVDPSVILRQMRDHGVTTSTASPPFFDRLATHVEAHRESRPRLRRILTGGAPVADDQLRLWQRSFPGTEILVVYGSTEAEPVAHIHAAERLKATSDIRPDSPGFCVGLPTDKVRTRVIRIVPGQVTPGDDLDVAEHDVGELCVTGDHVCKDYFRNPDAVRQNKLVESDGTVWHRMGDTGYFDRRGRFWLVGRVHSTIVRGGVAVHPQILEQSADPGDSRIRRVAAVGLPDAELGERVVLVLETSAENGLRGEVEERVKQSGQIVDDIVLTSEPLPVDPRHNSKIDYAKLRSRLRQQSGNR